MTYLSIFVSRALALRSTWAVAIVTFVWLAATTWTRPLILPDEGRYVGVAWEMLSTGSLSVPLLDGLPFFHKPPLFYWITALSIQVFGLNEWAARLSSVLSATLIVSIVFWFLKTYVNRQTAIVAAIILASQPFLFGGAQYANLDMTVAAMITTTVVAAAAAALRAESGHSYRWMLATAYGLAGLGFLAKGLIGVVLPGGVIFFWLLGRRRFDIMRRLFWLPGIGILLLVALPWMLAMQWRYPGFFDYYIVYQHFERFLEKGFNNPHPFWFYAPVLLVLTLPWSIQIWRLANKTYWTGGRDAAVRGLMLSWLLVILVFFSLPASKLVGYILPALAPFAFFLAEPFAIRLAGADPARGMRIFVRYLVLSITLCLAAVVTLVLAPQPSSKAVAHKMLAQYVPEDQIIMLERYRYDLNFYLRTGKPSFVVSNWSGPDVLLHDNWRKELYEAGRFDTTAADHLLIDKAGLMRKLCSSRTVALWLTGDKDSAQAYPFLADIAPYAGQGKLKVWRVPAGDAPKFCAEMPRIDLK